MQEIGFRNFNKIIYSKINCLEKNGVFNGKSIILFGINSSSHAVRRYLNEKGLDVEAYIDNDSAKVETNKEKIKNENRYKINTLKPEELKEFYSSVAILITSKYYKEMKVQLEKIGYVEEQDFFQLIDVNDLEKYVDFSNMDDMQEINLDTFKELQLKLLDYVDKICDEYNLRYYMSGGTLLGAVRHKGFIPWDDDIDIVLPMPDFKKFGEIVNSLKNEYRFLSLYSDNESYHSFYGRLMLNDTRCKNWNYPYDETFGISIDIFPLCAYPYTFDEAEKYYEYLEDKHTQIVEQYIMGQESKEEYKRLQNEILAGMEKYKYDESELIAYQFSQYRKKEIMPRKIYDGYVKLEFEDRHYRAASGYEEYLTRIFGDYMKLPPKEKQVTNHHCRAYIKK